MGIIPNYTCPWTFAEWKALPDGECNYNFLEMLWFYLALVLASFFTVSLLPGSIIKKLIPFVEAVILESNKGEFCWLNFFLI